jgi:crossover junction endodeoxyribonuclease RuvC
MQKEKIILGIDPGYDRMGVAVISSSLGKQSLIHSLCIETNKKDDFSKRILQIGNDLENIIKKYEPKHLSIESLFVTNNQKTAMRVAEARGVIIYIAEKMKLEIHEYTPMQIKSAVAGSGRADKKQVQFMVKNILKMKEMELKNMLDDEVDAIACAITCAAFIK